MNGTVWQFHAKWFGVRCVLASLFRVLRRFLSENNGVSQIPLFTNESELPEGFVYTPELISQQEEQALVSAIEQLEFVNVKMRDVVARRRVVHFGRSYEYETAALTSAPPIPEFLASLRQRVAEFAEREAQQFAEVLVTDYPPGAPIGWHRDAPGFDIIVGVSLLSQCTMRFRRWPVEKGVSQRIKPLKQILEPRSAYILRGRSRTAWQHSIPPVKQRRLSITFRTLRMTRVWRLFFDSRKPLVR